jgi:hypothetical protein
VFGSTAVTTAVTIVNNGTIGLRSSGAVTDLEIVDNATMGMARSCSKEQIPQMTKPSATEIAPASRLQTARSRAQARWVMPI